MGGRLGRPPKPLKLQMLEGDTGHRAYAKQEPQPANVEPDMPTDLDTMAAAEWQRVTMELRAMGLLYRADTNSLRVLCEAWSRYMAASASLAQIGPVFDSARGPAARPEVKQQADALAQYIRVSEFFALNPVARARLATKKDRTPQGELERLIKA